MALSESGPAPYAPARAIGGFIDQVRDKGFPTPVNVASITRIVEESLARRTLAALKQLDLITDDGMLTPTMEKIRITPSDQLEAVLADWLREVYKPIFMFVEPTDEVQRIADQFRLYEPIGMRNRMVTLFLGLCTKAGLIPDMPTIPRSRGEGTTGRKKLPQHIKPAKTEKPTPPANMTVITSEQNGSLDAARARYIDLLMSKVASQDEVDSDLLDRIERALGLVTTEGASP